MLERKKTELIRKKKLHLLAIKIQCDCLCLCLHCVPVFQFMTLSAMLGRSCPEMSYEVLSKMISNNELLMIPRRQVILHPNNFI